MPEQDDPGRGWLTLKHLAEIFDCSPQHAQRALVPLAGETRQRFEGRFYYHSRTIIDAWTAAHADSESLGSGPTDSPGLERLRAAKAGIAELELDERRGKVIRPEKLLPELLRLAGLIRRAGEKLRQQYGQAAADVVIEAIDEAERGWQQELESPKALPATEGQTA